MFPVCIQHNIMYRRVPADVLVYILLISIRVNPKRERISLKLSSISGSNFSKITEIVMLFKYSEIFLLLTSSDNDKHVLMRQKCEQGFAYICQEL